MTSRGEFCALTLSRRAPAPVLLLYSTIMLRHLGQHVQPQFRRLYHKAYSVSRPRRNAGAIAGLASCITVGTYLWYTNSRKIYNDAETAASTPLSTPLTPQSKFTSPEAKLWQDKDTLHALAWGSNRYATGFLRASLTESLLISHLRNFAKLSDSRSFDLGCGCFGKRREGFPISDHCEVAGQCSVEGYAVA